MALQAKQQEPAPSGPLDDLAGILRDDMAAVNALILDAMQSDVPLIPKLAGYLIASGGKRIRPLLTLACARMYGDESRRAYGLAAAVEFIHTATLLHDDVVDESTQRRGKQAANIVFGNQASVLVGDFLFSRAFQLMVSDGSLDVLRILSGASATIAEGEVKQLTTAGNLNTTMDDYLAVIRAKTAALFAAACEIGPVVAGQDRTQQRALCDYGLNLGIAFQIADDVLDYNADRAKLGKTVGDDFREGKMTAPVILALAQATADERVFWQRTLARKDQTPDDLGRAQALLEKYGTLKGGLDMAENYAAKAKAALAPAPAGPLRDCLAECAGYAVARSF